MQKCPLIVSTTIAFLLALTLNDGCKASPAEPTMHQIYEAATTGHVDQAQEMISQVLAITQASANELCRVFS
jgi:hypothetical protein